MCPREPVLFENNFHSTYVRAPLFLTALAVAAVSIIQQQASARARSLESVDRPHKLLISRLVIHYKYSTATKTIYCLLPNRSQLAVESPNRNDVELRRLKLTTGAGKRLSRARIESNRPFIREHGRHAPK